MINMEKAKEEIRKGIRAYLEKDEKGKYVIDRFYRMPYYLYGRPGIGKTQIVSQIAEEMGVGFLSYTLTHHTRNTLLGLPLIKELGEGNYTEYTESEILAGVRRKVMAGQKEGILLLDEFNCASETIMPAMLSFLQTGTIGAYTLPEGWVIVLCGNPSQYNKSARRFDAAIMDRVRLLEVDCDRNEFLEYASKRKMHASIQRFLKINPDYIYAENSNEPEKLVTCRGWENLSHAINMYETLGENITVQTVEQFIKNSGIAMAFYKAYWVFSQNITEREISRILSGNASEEISAKVAEKGFEFCHRFTQILVQELTSKKCSGATGPKISKGISNVFHFLETLPRSSELQDHYYQLLNTSGELLKVLKNNKNPEYLNVVKKSFCA